MSRLEDEHNHEEDIINAPNPEVELHAQLPSTPFPGLSSDQESSDGNKVQNLWAIDEIPTAALPNIRTEYLKGTAISAHQTSLAGTEAIVTPLRDLMKSSGIYMIGSMAPPLVGLVLGPFLAHHLSPSNYGILTLLNTLISLGAGISQLGLSSAFFRAYGYDYTSSSDRRAVLGTVFILLCLVSFPMAAGVAIMAPFLAQLFLGQSSLSGFIILATGVIVLRNLSIPGFAWLRAESRPLFYSLLSICNLSITLAANIFLVGALHLGLAGSLLATGCGYASVFIFTTPIILLHAVLRMRADIVRTLLTFGAPLVFYLMANWVLELADRYLLSILSSFAETARYAVAYTLGSALSILVIGPFTLAWPAAMFAIARREDAPQIFKLVFRWFSLFLLFAAFGLSLAGTMVLYWFFPVTYRSAAIVIPLVAESYAIFGAYYIVGSGVSIKRKTWLDPIFVAVAALVNVALNLVLISHYGALGAAESTLIAYIALASIGYLVNQRLYPVPYEVGIFLIALLLGAAFYVGSSLLGRGFGTYGAWGISLCALILYGGCLVLLGWLVTKNVSSTQTDRCEDCSDEKFIRS